MKTSLFGNFELISTMLKWNYFLPDFSSQSE